MKFTHLTVLLSTFLSSHTLASPLVRDVSLPSVDRRASNTTYPLPAKVVHNFPDGTWVENIAVRANGKILVTEVTRPYIYQVDPLNPKEAILVHNFTGIAPSILGIVETSPDIFYVCTGNSSATSPQYKDAYLFELDMRPFSPQKQCPAKVTMKVSIPSAGALDGLTYLGAGSNILMATDLYEGVIYSIKIATGEVKTPINNTYTHAAGLSANGLKYRNGNLYFTNTAQLSLVQVPINSQGEAVGNFTYISQGVFEPDDFAMDKAGDFYVTSDTEGYNGINFVPREGGVPTFIAGMEGPTACAFGRAKGDKDVLYVTTTGGDAAYYTGGKVKVSGKIYKIDVGRRGR